MPLRQLPRAFDHPDWIFEVKYDGFRSLAYLENQAVRLVSRKKHAYKAFADLCAWMGKNLKAREAVIDGEIVCLDELGRPVFNQLLFRRGTPRFCAFDLLWLNGRDLRDLDLIERKRVLKKLVGDSLPRVLYVDHFDKSGVDLFREACSHDLEGIVAKWKLGTYANDEERSTWFKIWNPHYSQAKGRQELFQRKPTGKVRAGSVLENAG